MFPNTNDFPTLGAEGAGDEAAWRAGALAKAARGLGCDFTLAAIHGDGFPSPLRLAADAVIAPEKLSGYLLQRREDHDKAGFLALAGYTSAHAGQLEADLRTQILPVSAEPAGATPYGDKFIIRGSPRGPNGRTLRVLSVWMREKATGQTKFVTPYPDPS